MYYHFFRVLAACAVLCASCAQATNVVTAITHFAVSGGNGDYNTSALLCTENGGFLPAEINSAYHDHILSQAINLGAGNEWYAYLGGSTFLPASYGDASKLCPPDALHGGYGSILCSWRWNQGRWLYLIDGRRDINYVQNSGISFFVSNSIRLKSQVFSINGFVSYFSAPTNGTVGLDERPGNFFGQYLVLVGDSTASRWSDNANSGGYVYKDYSLSSNGVFVENSASVEVSKSHFITVCEVQPMYRETYELFNSTSTIQKSWWAVLFAIFFVIALVGFIITAACQEREDMDEPPEDAPEWAEKQQKARHTKSFVSMRSFRQYNDDNGAGMTREDNYGAENADNYAAQDRQHSFREGNNQNPLADPGYSDQGSHHPSMRDNWM